MSGRYIDFVPANKKKTTKQKPAAKVPVAKVDGRIKTTPEIKYEKVIVEEDIVESSADTFSLKNDPEYGVIEDLHPRFVKTEVPKRPLSQRRSMDRKSDVVAAKAEKIAAKKIATPVKNSNMPDEAKEDSDKMKIPKSPFINHAKVIKRPLSKNVYEKKIEPTAEKDTGVVTIITKPEKDKKAGLIVTIILTIMLGAVAGTVAFLLLPK